VNFEVRPAKKNRTALSTKESTPAMFRARKMRTFDAISSMRGVHGTPIRTIRYRTSSIEWRAVMPRSAS